jgi:hypothetical protein
VLARALAIAEKQDDPDLVADIECTIVRTQMDAERYDLAEEHMQSARTALARAPNAEVATKVDCLRAEAEVADARQDREGSDRALEIGRSNCWKTRRTRAACSITRCSPISAACTSEPAASAKRSSSTSGRRERSTKRARRHARPGSDGH